MADQRSGPKESFQMTSNGIGEAPVDNSPGGNTPTWPDSEVSESRVSFWSLFKQQWLYVLTDCLVFGSFGMGVAFLGPTLFDLGCQTNSDLKEMNWVFFVQLFMTLMGSISAGCLAER
jgi:hypothetical protein